MTTNDEQAPRLTPDDLAELKARLDAGDIRLLAGHHDVTKSGVACAMDLIVWRATGRIGDTHECVHPLISTHIHTLNDREDATSESRWELVEHAGPAILGTADLPAAHVSFALFGAETGAAIADGLAKIREAHPSQLLAERVAAVLEAARAADAATTGYRAPAATTGDRAPAATTGYRAPAATTGDWAPARDHRLPGAGCDHRQKLDRGIARRWPRAGRR